MKYWIYTHDPVLTLVYSREEAIELFGEDALEEYGVELPDALVLEITQTYKRLLELAKELQQKSGK